MRNTLGDYREKMAEDERKFSKTVSAVKFTSALADRKSIFVKKAAGRGIQDSNRQMNNRRMENILQNTEQAVSDSDRTDPPFRFNFQACQ